MPHTPQHSPDNYRFRVLGDDFYQAMPERYRKYWDEIPLEDKIEYDTIAALNRVEQANPDIPFKEIEDPRYRGTVRNLHSDEMKGREGSAALGGFIDAAARTGEMVGKVGQAIAGIFPEEIRGGGVLPGMATEARQLNREQRGEAMDANPLATMGGAAAHEVPKWAASAGLTAGAVGPAAAGVAKAAPAGSRLARGASRVASAADDYLTGGGSFVQNTARDVPFGIPFSIAEAKLAPNMRDNEGNLLTDENGQPIQENLSGIAKALEGSEPGVLNTLGKVGRATSSVPVVGEVLTESLFDVGMAAGAHAGAGAIRGLRRAPGGAASTDGTIRPDPTPDAGRPDQRSGAVLGSPSRSEPPQDLSDRPDASSLAEQMGARAPGGDQLKWSRPGGEQGPMARGIMGGPEVQGMSYTQPEEVISSPWETGRALERFAGEDPVDAELLPNPNFRAGGLPRAPLRTGLDRQIPATSSAPGKFDMGPADIPETRLITGDVIAQALARARGTRGIDPDNPNAGRVPQASRADLAQQRAQQRAQQTPTTSAPASRTPPVAPADAATQPPMESPKTTARDLYERYGIDIDTPEGQDRAYGLSSEYETTPDDLPPPSYARNYLAELIEKVQGAGQQTPPPAPTPSRSPAPAASGGKAQAIQDLYQRYGIDISTPEGQDKAYGLSPEYEVGPDDLPPKSYVDEYLKGRQQQGGQPSLDDAVEQTDFSGIIDQLPAQQGVRQAPDAPPQSFNEMIEGMSTEGLVDEAAGPRTVDDIMGAPVRQGVPERIPDPQRDPTAPEVQTPEEAAQKFVRVKALQEEFREFADWARSLSTTKSKDLKKYKKQVVAEARKRFGFPEYMKERDVLRAIAARDRYLERSVQALKRTANTLERAGDDVIDTGKPSVPGSPLHSGEQNPYTLTDNWWARAPEEAGEYDGPPRAEIRAEIERLTDELEGASDPGALVSQIDELYNQLRQAPFEGRAPTSGLARFGSQKPGLADDLPAEPRVRAPQPGDQVGNVYDPRPAGFPVEDIDVRDQDIRGMWAEFVGDIAREGDNIPMPDPLRQHLDDIDKRYAGKAGSGSTFNNLAQSVDSEPNRGAKNTWTLTPRGMLLGDDEIEVIGEELTEGLADEFGRKGVKALHGTMTKSFPNGPDGDPVFTVMVGDDVKATGRSKTEAEAAYARWFMNKTNRSVDVPGMSARELGNIQRSAQKVAETLPDGSLEQEKMRSLARTAGRGDSLMRFEPELRALAAKGMINRELFETLLVTGGLSASAALSKSRDQMEEEYNVAGVDTGTAVAVLGAMALGGAALRNSGVVRSFTKNAGDFWQKSYTGTWNKDHPLNRAHDLAVKAGRAVQGQADRIRVLAAHRRGALQPAAQRFKDEWRPVHDMISNIKKSPSTVWQEFESSPVGQKVMEQIHFSDDALRDEAEHTGSRHVSALLYAQRALELVRNKDITGKKTPLTERELVEAIRLLKKDPRISETADATRAIYRQNLDRRLEVGAISQQEYDDIIARGENYVPFERNMREIYEFAEANGLDDLLSQVRRSTSEISMEDMRKMDWDEDAVVRVVTQEDGTKTAQVHHLQVLDPVEQLMYDIASTEFARARTMVNNQMIATFKDFTDTKDLKEFGIRRVTDPRKLRSITSGVSDESNMVVLKGFKDGDSNNEVVEYAFEVDDAMKFALKGNPLAGGAVLSMFRGFKNFQRAAITLTPFFAIRNGIRDLWFSTVGQSRAEIARGAAGGAAVGYLSGEQRENETYEQAQQRALMRSMIGMSLGGVSQQAMRVAKSAFDLTFGVNADLQDLYMMSGGGSSGFIGSGRDDRALAGNVLKRLEQHDGGLRSLMTMNPLRFMEVVGQITENAPRFAEFKKAIARGEDPLTAAAMARDISVDFSKGGSNKWVQGISQGEAFFNATLQGWDTFVRRMADTEGTGQMSRSGFAKAAAIVTPISFALWNLNKDNEEYWKEPTYIRNTFWLIPNPFFKSREEEDWAASTPFFKMPKPHEFGWMFGSLLERMLDAGVESGDIEVEGVEPGILSRSFSEAATEELKTFAGQYGFGDLFPMSTAVRPVLEAAVDYDFFRQRNINPRRDLGANQTAPELQYRSTTPGPYRAIGDAVNISPSKIQHVAESYGGDWVGQPARLVDKLMAETGVGGRHAAPVNLVRGSEGGPVDKALGYSGMLDAFTSVPESRSEREYQMYERFGESAQDISRMDNMRQTGQTDRLMSFVENNREKLMEAGVLGKAYDIVSELQGRVREIERAPNLSREDRRRFIIQINDAADESLKQLGIF